MNHHDEEAPKLPLLPFFVADAMLLATAAIIAFRASTPIPPAAMLAITICVVLGAALLVVPFLANYARRQDAELTERQHQIAALARTTADSAEQIGIVAAGLGSLVETSRQNLDTLGQFSGRIQQHIDTLKQHTPTVAAPATGAEDIARLEAAIEKIVRSLAKAETTATAKNDALASAERDLAAALARAATQVEALVASANIAAEHLSRAPAAPQTTPPAIPVTPAVQPDEPVVVVPPDAVPTPPPAEEAPAAKPAKKSGSAKSSAKPAASREATEPASPEPATSGPTAHVTFDPAPSATPTPFPEPAPIASEISAPLTTASSPDESPSEPFTATEPADGEVPVDEPAVAKAPRARKARLDDDGFDLGLTPEAQEPPETAVTSDGFTRLVATAYIGIGNKLFIRGEGPGLSWDKGVPLQFVSIGKWRWETPDATAPIAVKLYKNDQIECSGLGKLTLEPGRQTEVNAGF